MTSCDVFTSIGRKPFLASRRATTSTRLVWFEIYDDAASAIAREKELKKWRRDWKIRLIEEQIRVGGSRDSQLTFVVMDSGLAPRGAPGMTKENKNPGVAVGGLHFVDYGGADP